jgi:hypothetical protein
VGNRVTTVVLSMLSVYVVFLRQLGAALLSEVNFLGFYRNIRVKKAPQSEAFELLVVVTMDVTHYKL